MNITIVKRDISRLDLQQVQEGFDHNTLDKGVAVQNSDRFTYVSESNDSLIGCASGLAYKNGEEYSGWFYLTAKCMERMQR